MQQLSAKQHRGLSHLHHRQNRCHTVKFRGVCCRTLKYFDPLQKACFEDRSPETLISRRPDATPGPRDEKPAAAAQAPPEAITAAAGAGRRVFETTSEPGEAHPTVAWGVTLAGGRRQGLGFEKNRCYPGPGPRGPPSRDEKPAALRRRRRRSRPPKLRKLESGLPQGA